jgi:hypothetical protein
MTLDDAMIQTVMRGLDPRISLPSSPQRKSDLKDHRVKPGDDAC